MISSSHGELLIDIATNPCSNEFWHEYEYFETGMREISGLHSVYLKRSTFDEVTGTRLVQGGDAVCIGNLIRYVLLV